jgi:hypothetical protein
MDSFIQHNNRRGGALKNCDLCHGMGVDEMGQSVTGNSGKGRDVKEFYFEKRFLALRNKRMWPLASKLLLLRLKVLLLSSKLLLFAQKLDF